MTIEKLKSGSYRITQMENGKRYRVTVDHKPSKTEAIKLLADIVEKKPVSSNNMTFDDAADRYIQSKSKILSPSTIRDYQKLRRNVPETLSQAHIYDLTSLKVQTAINDMASLKSPKTLANYSSFIVAVLKSADIDIKHPQLPQKEKKDIYIPSKEDVQRIFNHIKGKEEEIVIILAAHGLRRSEIAALTLSDLEGNTLTINKAMVQDEAQRWVIKGTKTTDSTRTVIIPEDVADMIREKGYIYNKMPYTINQDLHRAQKELGIPQFSLHKLRHFFASFCHDLGFSDKAIQSMGGWRSDSILRTVYTHALDMEQKKKEMSESLSKLRG